MAQSDRPRPAPSEKQLAARETFKRKYGGRLRELVKREREAANGEEK